MGARSPIPDLPLEEYQLAGYTAWSPWQRLLRRVNWGHRSTFRKIWVDRSATAGDRPLLISSVVESWHCPADATLLFDAAKPSVEVLTQFSELHVEISDESSSGVRIFHWDRGGLNFALRSIALGNSVCDVLALARGEHPSSVELDNVLAGLRQNLRASESRPRRCVQTLWRFLFGIALIGLAAGIPALIFGATVSTALGLGSLASLFVVVIYVAACYVVGSWFARGTQNYLNAHWSRLFNQGDHDGSVRRALASIGVELPAENSSA